MKKIKFTLITICFALIIKAQQNQGIVIYQTTNIDTINNTINIQDSIYSKFVFKPHKTKWELGFVNQTVITKTILNGEDFYLIIDESNSKTATHGEMPNQNSYNQLLNYKDTSLIIFKTTVTKTIAGRSCKKISIQLGSSSPKMVLWYDETVNCNSIVPGAGLNGKNIKGLIMEYEIPTPFGKSIISANSVTFGNVPNSQFNPNLSGYEITELERENGGQCNGHH